MKEKDFVLNIEKNGNVSCSIGFLKALHYSIKKMEKDKEAKPINILNCDAATWKKTQRIDTDIIHSWLSTLSKRHGFSYQVKDNDRKGMLIFRFEA